MYAYAEGTIAGREALFLITENEEGGKATIRVRPTGNDEGDRTTVPIRPKDDGYAFNSSEALVESMLGRQLIPDGEKALVNATRRWLTENGCPREPHARGRGRCRVPFELAQRFQTECWPEIKHLASGV